MDTEQMNAKDIVQKYDRLELKGFDESEIGFEFSSIPIEERSGTENLAEWTAFKLVEGGDNNWQTYYGPFLITPEGNCVPSRESITPEIIQVWEQRLNEVSNPILKARYSGLLVEFKQKCDGQIRKTHVESLLDCVNGHYLKHDQDYPRKLVRAFHVANSMKNTQILDSVKEAIVKYETSSTSDYDAKLWCPLFRLMLENMSQFSEEEEAFASRMENRIAKLCDKQLDGKGAERFDVFVIEQGSVLLAKYYVKKQKKEEAKRVLDNLNAAFHKGFSSFSVIQINGMLDNLLRLYNSFGFQTEAKKVLVELQQNSEALTSALSTIDASVKIPVKTIEKHVQKITEGTFDEVIGKFLFTYIPDKNEMQETLREKVVRNPLYAAITHQLLDYKGRPTSIIRSIKSDFDGHLILHINDVLESYSIYLHPVIQNATEKGLFNTTTILQYVKNSPFFESDRIPIVEQGLNSFFNGDYVTFLHLIIPQIENAIRNIVEESGHSTIKFQKHGDGFEIKTLEELLRDDAIVQLDEGNLSLYLRVLFTDQRGWNLRNNICHGSAPLSWFNPTTADRVFHALICVASITLVKD